MKKAAKALSFTDEGRRMNMWNDKHKIGSKVELMLDDGTVFPTKTTSLARQLDHGQAVVEVEGKKGGWALGRVRPAAKV